MPIGRIASVAVQAAAAAVCKVLSDHRLVHNGVSAAVRVDTAAEACGMVVDKVAGENQKLATAREEAAAVEKSNVFGNVGARDGTVDVERGRGERRIVDEAATEIGRVESDRRIFDLKVGNVNVDT